MCLKKTYTLWQVRQKADLVTTFLVTLLFGTLVLNPLYSCSNNNRGTIEVCFTPGGRCIQLIEKVIAEAEQEILVQAYFFTSATIAQALIAAYTKGVVVKILVDRSQLTQQGSQLKNLLNSGIVILLDLPAGIAHNKIMIIDETYVLTGSYNWTPRAEYKNAENIILINNKSINQEYRQNWEQRAQGARAISLKDIKATAR